MKLPTLQALLHVEALGSIRAAAQAMHLSQPALTAAIQQLEDELGAPLLVRTKQGAGFTEFGRAFLPRARVILAESRRAREEIGQLRGAWEGSIRFSSSPAVGLSLLPLVVPRFRAEHPGIAITFRDGLYPGITPALRDGSLDFGLTPVHRLDLEADLLAEPLFVTEVVIVCRRDHPLRGARSLKELAGCEWVLSSGPRGPGAVVDEAFAGCGLPPPPRALVCESFLALPGLVANSTWMATVPRLLFDLNAFRDQLVQVPVQEQLPSPTVHVVRRHDLPLTPAAQKLIGWIRHHAQALPRGRP